MTRSIWASLTLVMFLLLSRCEGVARQNIKRPLESGGVTGTYKFVLNTLEVLELPDHKVRIRFTGFWPNDRKRTETRNSGAFDETVALEDQTATVKIQFGDEPCTIKVGFRPGKVIVEQSGSLMSCGFGFNVEPDGTYVKVSSSVLVFNGHLWHSGTANRSNRSRRVVHCCFVGREELRFSRIKVNAPDDLSPAARYLLAV